MTEWQQLGARLQTFIYYLKTTQRAVSQELEIEQGYFNQIIKGRKKISSTVILGLAKRYQELSLRWLLLGDGEMIESQPAYIIQVKEPDPGYDDSVENILRDHERRLRALEKKIPLIE